MYLSVHTCVGAIIGRFSPNPIVAFLLGIVSHFILDMIPHGDMKTYEEFRKGKKVVRELSITLLDGIFSMYVAMFILVGYARTGHEINIAAGIIGAGLPDVLTLIYRITKIKFLKCVDDLHYFAHRIIPQKKEIPYFFGIAYQIILLFCLLIYTRTF
ncbi:MAG: hypothetical protein U9P90_03375 [Patescibacteria group bacterium]|nr:hypothetical protein [Patescibacteria group bacterium]